MKRGLFISKCGGAVSGALDVEQLGRNYASLEAVRIVEDFYEPADLASLLDDVAVKHLEGVVLAGDSPLSFSDTRAGDQILGYLGARGVDRNRIQIVNLKNMVVKPHKASREALLEKARLLIDVGLAKVAESRPVAEVEVAPRKAVAVVGGTGAALAVALHLVDEGYRVHLLHKGPQLALPAQSAGLLRPLLTAVVRNERVKVHPDASLVDLSGYSGDYLLKVTSGGGPFELRLGAIVVATDRDTAQARELQAVCHVDLDEGGVVASKDEATLRSNTQERGIFVVASSKQPGDVSASLLAADAAAASVINLLNRSEITHRHTVSEVDTKLCGGCGVCVKTCMFHAVTLQGDPPVSHIDPRRCRGCGNCVTACPSAARDLVACPTSYLESAVDILARFSHAERGRKILLIACSGCGYRGLDKAAEAGLTWPVGIMPLQVVCGGQLDTRIIMQAFVRGFDGVIMLVCGEGCCHNIIGNVDLERRVNLLREVLASRGIDHERMHIVSTCSRKGTDCVESINEFYQQFGNKSLNNSTVMLGGSVGARP